MTDDAEFRPWSELSAREKAVWGAAYALSTTLGLDAARHAERVCNSMAEVRWPEVEAPEFRASRLCSGLSRDEFGAWYRIELRMQVPSRRRYKATDAEIDDAYQRYVMSAADFY